VVRHGRSRGAPLRTSKRYEQDSYVLDVRARARRTRTDPASLVALLAARDERPRTTGYAASDFFAGELSDFFESDFDESDFEESDFDESDLDSAFSLPDRSISRLRRFVP
jgi:hypothetical protein